MSVLKNVKVMWAMVHTPDTKFAPTWHIRAMLDDNQAKELSEEAKKVFAKGIKIKLDDEGNKYFEFKRKVNRQDGSENKPPLVCGKAGPKEPFTENIGNGSVCNIQYRFATYKNTFGEGVIPDLQGVQVLKHVPYSGSEFGSEDEVQDEEDSVFE